MECIRNRAVLDGGAVLRIHDLAARSLARYSRGTNGIRHCQLNWSAAEAHPCTSFSSPSVLPFGVQVIVPCRRSLQGVAGAERCGAGEVGCAVDPYGIIFYPLLCNKPLQNNHLLLSHTFLWVDGAQPGASSAVDLGVSHAFAVRWWPQLGSWRLSWAGTSKMVSSLTCLVPSIWPFSLCGVILGCLSAWPFSSAGQLECLTFRLLNTKVQVARSS